MGKKTLALLLYFTIMIACYCSEGLTEISNSKDSTHQLPVLYGVLVLKKDFPKEGLVGDIYFFLLSETEQHEYTTSINLQKKQKVLYLWDVDSSKKHVSHFLDFPIDIISIIVGLDATSDSVANDLKPCLEHCASALEVMLCEDSSGINGITCLRFYHLNSKLYFNLKTDAYNGFPINIPLVFSSSYPVTKKDVYKKLINKINLKYNWKP